MGTNHSIFLIPARTDTKWFRKLIEHGVIIYFIQGRIKFNDGKNVAPFPSMIVEIANYKKTIYEYIDKELAKEIFESKQN